MSHFRPLTAACRVLALASILVGMIPPAAVAAEQEPAAASKQTPSGPVATDDESDDESDREVEQDFAAELARIPPLTPEEGRDAIITQPGYQIELVAAEPRVTDPVAMCFDADGRLYVVEMRDYSEQDKERLGRIRLLEDLDGDGYYERSSIFADDLSWPTAVIAYDGGIFVGAAPELLYLKDSDGDREADVREVVFRGFGRSNVQGLINSFRWGLDNRIHGATSSAGGEIVSPKVGTQEPVDLSGRDFSFDPRTLELRPESGGAQHGLCFDDWGRKFVCSNSDHLQAVMYEDRYAARNPHVLAPSARVSIAADGPQAPVFRKSPVEPWRIVRTRLRVAGSVPGPIEGGGKPAGYFTSATGVTIYRGDLLPGDRNRAFIADVGSNIVHRKEIEDDGLLPTGRRIDPQSEFLAATDIWFRPVQFDIGPDGALYLLDMSREVIEHPASLPPIIKRHLDLTSGREQGRIYRVTPIQYQRRTSPQLSRSSSRDLVALLRHANSWHRETAARLLFQRRDLSIVPVLEDTVRNETSPLGRLHALYVLDGMGALSDQIVAAALEDEHPRVRQHAVRLSESFVDSGLVRARLATAVEDEDQRVRRQAAFSIGEFPRSWQTPLAAKLLARDGDDDWMRFAALSSLSTGAGDVLAQLVSSGELQESTAATVVRELAELIARQGDDSEVASALHGALAADTPAHLRDLVVQSIALGLAESQSNMLGEMADTSGRIVAEQIERAVASLVAAAAKTAVDREAPLAQRVDALRTLSLTDEEEITAAILNLLDQSEPEDVQLAALESLAQIGPQHLGHKLVERWKTTGPEVRNEAIEVLLSRPDWTNAYLSAIEQGALGPTDWNRSRLALLRTTASRDIRLRLDALIESQPATERSTVVQRYKKALQLAGDVDQGRTVFRKNCAACHQVEEFGKPIGPNLVALSSRGAEAILVNVLDPNREVNPAFVTYSVLTDAGRTYSGMISNQSATTVTLVRADGHEQSLLRQNIEEMRSNGASLMPEGLEREINVEQMADLIAYLDHVAKLPAGEATLGWQAGVARKKITPAESMWMSGYASRNKPATGKLTDLWAKSLILQDGHGERFILLTLDLVGIDRSLSEEICGRIGAKYNVPRKSIALCVSHTHTGPIVGDNLSTMVHDLDAVQRGRIDRYARELVEALVEVVGEAFADLEPATLSHASGITDFAVNRRNNREADVPQLRQEGRLRGPVDHDVPVLAVRDGAGRLKALTLGYACHATTLSSYQWSGDWPGFAQIEIERRRPQAMALFWAGCGADQNPLPRRTVELAQQYGTMIADAVDRALAAETEPLAPRLTTSYEEIPLAFDELPTRDDLVNDAKSTDPYVAARARRLLDKLDTDGSLAATYPYPIQVTTLGDDVTFVLLGGEVVVDYSNRLKAELRSQRVWVAGYANDVMAYIPSRRVLREGGYEGKTAMVYYGLPTAWAEAVEEDIVSTVKRLSDGVETTTDRAQWVKLTMTFARTCNRVRCATLPRGY